MSISVNQSGFDPGRPPLVTVPSPQLVEALRQPVPGADWGVLRTTLLGTISFGLLPLLIWPSEFRESTCNEARQLEAVAQWAQQGSDNKKLIARLLSAARATPASAFVSLLPVLLGLYVATMFCIEFAQRPFDIRSLMNQTYWAQAPQPPHYHDTPRSPSRYEPAEQLVPAPRYSTPYYTHRYTTHPPYYAPREQREPSEPEAPALVAWPRGGPFERLSLHAAWCIVLSAAYVLHLAQVRNHAVAVRRFTAVFHATLPGDSPVTLPTIYRGNALFWPLAIVAGVGFAHLGAWWGIPMLLAAGARRGYVRQTSRRLRASITARMGDVVSSFNQRLDRTVLSICPARGCGATLPQRARFCARCGTNVTPAAMV